MIWIDHRRGLDQVVVVIVFKQFFLAFGIDLFNLVADFIVEQLRNVIQRIGHRFQAAGIIICIGPGFIPGIYLGEHIAHDVVGRKLGGVVFRVSDRRHVAQSVIGYGSERCLGIAVRQAGGGQQVAVIIIGVLGDALLIAARGLDLAGQVAGIVIFVLRYNAERVNLLDTPVKRMLILVRDRCFIRINNFNQVVPFIEFLAGDMTALIGDNQVAAVLCNALDGASVDIDAFGVAFFVVPDLFDHVGRGADAGIELFFGAVVIKLEEMALALAVDH